MNWDNPDIPPALVSCGLERVGRVQAQLRRGEHIDLIFVQCWEKTSPVLHSLGHRPTEGARHCRMAAAGEASQPSESNTRPRGTVAPSAKWGPEGKGCIFLHICNISTRHALHIQFFFLPYTVT